MTKKNELKSGYDSDFSRLQSFAKKAIEDKKPLILHLKRWTKALGHHNLLERQNDRTIELLRALKLKFELGNDAPKGGATGDYILIPLQELKKLF